MKIGTRKIQKRLTPLEVERIRERYRRDRISQHKLAREYQVSQSTVWSILKTEQQRTGT